MIFAKVDVTFPVHHRMLKIQKAYRAACLGVWTAALCYSRGAELDGLCPIEAIETMATDELIDWLVTVGLFRRVTLDGIGHVEVLKYAEHNETKVEIEKRRNATKKRVAEYRKQRGNAGCNAVRNAHGNADVTGAGIVSVPGSDSDSVSDLSLPLAVSLSAASATAGGSGLREPEAQPFATEPPSEVVRIHPEQAPAVAPSGKLPDGVVSFEKSAWVAAYERAVDKARGPHVERYSFPTKQFAALRAVVEKHCLGEDRKRIDAWIERDVAEFVDVVSDDEPLIRWGNFGPDGWQKWHNADRRGLAKGNGYAGTVEISGGKKYVLDRNGRRVGIKQEDGSVTPLPIAKSVAQ